MPRPISLSASPSCIKKDLAGTIKSYKDLNDAKYTVASKLGTTGEQATKRMIPNAKYISYETEQEGVHRTGQRQDRRLHL